MDATSQGIHVTIFGDEYSVKGDVDIDTTRNVAEYVSRMMTDMSEKSTSYNKLRIAILSALNIAGELFENKAQNEGLKKKMLDIERRVEMLEKRIAEAL